MSYALGLRTLTSQTGRSYRDDLNLKQDELAILKVARLTVLCSSSTNKKQRHRVLPRLRS